MGMMLALEGGKIPAPPQHHMGCPEPRLSGPGMAPKQIKNRKRVGRGTSKSRRHPKCVRGMETPPPERTGRLDRWPGTAAKAGV